MKKSFLKRAMAAAAAVPFALTQTAMFTSFAADGDSAATVIGVSTFLDVEGDLTANAAKEGKDFAFKVSKDVPAEAGEKYAIYQESDWNEELRSALTAMQGDVTLNPAKLADSISSTAWYSDLVKTALRAEGTTVKAEIKNDEVVVTIDVNSNCGQYIADHATAGLGAEYQAAVKNLKSSAVIKGQIVVTADISNLDVDKNIPLTATAKFDGMKSGMLDETAIAFGRDVLAQAEKDIKAAVTAKGLDASKLDSTFNRYEGRLDTAERAADKAGKSYSKDFTASDGADLWKQARNFAVEQSTRFERVPEELSDAKQTQAYSCAADIFTQVVEEINKKPTTQKSGYTVKATLDDVVAVVEDAKTITASFSAESYKYDGNAWGYLTDQDFDANNYKTYFDELVAKDGLKVTEIKNVKVFEVVADAKEVANGANGNVYLNVYRIVYPVTEKKYDPEKPEGRTDVKITLKDRFCFSHDPRFFEDLGVIESATIITEDAEGNKTERPMSADELKNIRLSFYEKQFWTVDEENELTKTMKVAQPDGKQVSPQSAFADETLNPSKAYVAQPIYAYYENELVADATANILIGVKGDANLDGTANATDAAKVLIYAADYGAKKNPSLYSETNEIMENFAYFLADTTGESEDHGKTASYDASTASALNATDAAQILTYAAIAGADKDHKCDWIPDVIKNAPYPTYSYEIAVGAGLIEAQ